jgi:hypothetical protein
MHGRVFHGMSSILTRDEWLEILERMALALPAQGPPVKVCLIGAAPCILEAMPGRASHDLDVWMPESDFDRLELKQAAESAGLLFDPRGPLEPDKPYLQLIIPGPTQVGDFTPVLWSRLGRLHIYRPPWPHLIASKLVRGDERDVDDILFMAGKQKVSQTEVAACADGMPSPAREQLLENLIYLSILDP